MPKSYDDDDDDDAEVVLSSVHITTENSTSPYSKDLQVTTFTAQSTRRDEPPYCIEIRHRLATTISHVGLQVWLGACLIIDYMHIQPNIRNTTILELGSGTGICSIYCSKLGAKQVYCTDIDIKSDEVDLLDLIKLNVDHNNTTDTIRIRELDLTDKSHPVYATLAGTGLLQTLDLSPSTPYSWTEADISDIASTSYIIAADIIYDDSLTFNLICRLPDLLGHVIHERVLILALEKRINFTLEDMAPVAHARDFMLKTLEALNADRADEGLREVKYECVDVESIKQVLNYERNEFLDVDDVS